MPKVSVIMACYNHSHYLGDSIGSVIGQSHQDWELIFVDDGSTDDSFSQAEKIASGNPAVKLIRQENRGQAKARQAGLDVADGEFIVLLDSDDYLEPEMMARCVERFASNLEIDVVAGDAIITSEDVAVQKGILEQRRTPGWPGLLRQNCFGAPGALMLRREKVIDAGGIEADVGNGAEDWDLWTRLARIGGTFSVLRQPIARYRLSESNHSLNFGRALEPIIQLLDFSRGRDSRLPSNQQPAVTKRQYAKYRNGQVLRAFYADWWLGKKESELSIILTQLEGPYIHMGYCQDMLVDVAYRLAHEDDSTISRLSEKERDALLVKAFAEKGLSHHAKAAVNLVWRVHTKGLRHHSWSGRLFNKWMSLAQRFG